MKRESFILLLENLIQAIKDDDSMEGRLQYQWSPSRPGELDVEGFIRTGNSMGQGGAVIIQDPAAKAWLESSQTPPEQGQSSQT
jgi:hypothetical protein